MNRAVFDILMVVVKMLFSAVKNSPDDTADKLGIVKKVAKTLSDSKSPDETVDTLETVTKVAKALSELKAPDEKATKAQSESKAADEPEVEEEATPEPDGEAEPQRSFISYYQVDLLGYDADETNAMLRSKGLPAISEDEGQGGGAGFQYMRGRLVIEGNGEGRGSQTDGKQYITSFGVGSGFVNAGYAFKKSGLLKVFPLVGVGGGGMSVSSKEQDDNGEAGEETESLELNTAAMLVNTGLGIDFTPRIWRFGLLLGLRVGYNSVPDVKFTVGDENTEEEVAGEEMAGEEVDENPLDFSGPYLRFIVGGGYVK